MCNIYTQYTIIVYTYKSFFVLNMAHMSLLFTHKRRFWPWHRAFIPFVYQSWRVFFKAIIKEEKEKEKRRGRGGRQEARKWVIADHILFPASLSCHFLFYSLQILKLHGRRANTHLCGDVTWNIYRFLLLLFFWRHKNKTPLWHFPNVNESWNDKPLT